MSETVKETSVASRQKLRLQISSRVARKSEAADAVFSQDIPVKEAVVPESKIDSATIMLALMTGREICIGPTMYRIFFKEREENCPVAHTGLYVKSVEATAKWAFSSYQVSHFVQMLERSTGCCEIVS